MKLRGTEKQGRPALGCPHSWCSPQGFRGLPGGGEEATQGKREATYYSQSCKFLPPGPHQAGERSQFASDFPQWRVTGWVWRGGELGFCFPFVFVVVPSHLTLEEFCSRAAACPGHWTAYRRGFPFFLGCWGCPARLHSQPHLTQQQSQHPEVQNQNRGTDVSFTCFFPLVCPLPVPPPLGKTRGGRVGQFC